MRKRSYFTLTLIGVGIFFGLLSCSEDEEPIAPSPQPGRVSISAAGITGQNGNMFAVMAYGYDWQPGAQDPFLAAHRATIAEDNFSFSDTLQSIDQNGQLTGQAKLFDPGVYSIVFFVAVPNQPPSIFAEVRATVNGDITVTAPAWATWQR
jgi:hypothetical protein